MSWCKVISYKILYQYVFHSITGLTQHSCPSLAFISAVSKFCGFITDLQIIIKSPKQRLETYCFCSVSYYYYYSYSYSYSYYSPFFPCTMNLSTADLRNYRTEFHETWWSYRYMFLVDPKVFWFVVKGVKVIFLGFQRGWGLL